MSDELDSTTAMDARRLTRRRREQRTDHVLEINFHERQAIECPTCGHEWMIAIHGPVEQASPSFHNCSDWDCDAYLKLVHDGTEREPEPEAETSRQTDLEQFSGGASA